MQDKAMSYPQYVKSRAPEINLPYPKCGKPIIYEFYEIDELGVDPRKNAKCKECGEEIFVIVAKHVSSSYTSGLISHLQNHSNYWIQYLDLLKDTMSPDINTNYEHFQSMINQYSSASSNSGESSIQLNECFTNSDLNRKNCAGTVYVPRDIEVLKKRINYKSQNAQILEYLQPYTNWNINIIELIGTQHPNARLDVPYKKSTYIVDNIGNITLDLERLFCDHVCFFDPELYDNCTFKHTGNIEIFSKSEYQNRFRGFKQEIEKYPEFQNNKSFNVDILLEAEIIEYDKTAVREMNRLLKILLSLLVVHKANIKVKINKLIEDSIDSDNLQKPSLGIQLWGPNHVNVDLDAEEDASSAFPESDFSTFQHVNNASCPGYTTLTKLTSQNPHLKDGKAFYPCNNGYCLKGCVCIPCKYPEKYSEPYSFRCSYHKIDHPQMFNGTEDFAITRRKYVQVDSIQPIYKRPIQDKYLCPPKLKLAQLKKECKKCIKIVNDHRKNHHILHSVCQICDHLIRLSTVSFQLACYLCLKLFKNKTSLADHMHIHDDDKTFYCSYCDKGFTRKFNYEKHILTNHSDKKEEFECSDCQKTFSSQSNLTRHTKTKHTPHQKEYVCNNCNKKFERQDTLLRHERTDHNLRRDEVVLPGINEKIEPFQCYICKEIFKDKNTVIRHIESIHAKKSFQCNICGNVYKRKDTLQIHMQCHNFTLPKISCEICRQQFIGNQN